MFRYVPLRQVRWGQLVFGLFCSVKAGGVRYVLFMFVLLRQVRYVVLKFGLFCFGEAGQVSFVRSR